MRCIQRCKCRPRALPFTVMSNQHQCHVYATVRPRCLPPDTELEQLRTRVALEPYLMKMFPCPIRVSCADASPPGTWNAGNVERFRSQQLCPTLCLPNERAIEHSQNFFECSSTRETKRQSSHSNRRDFSLIQSELSARNRVE